jgi:hypothetical protein
LKADLAHARVLWERANRAATRLPGGAYYLAKHTVAELDASIDALEHHVGGGRSDI